MAALTDIIRIRRQDHSWFILLQCILLGIVLDVCAPLVVRLPLFYDRLAAVSPELRRALLSAGTAGLIDILTMFGAFCCALIFVGWLAGLVRRRWALLLVRKTYIAAVVLCFLYAYAVFDITGVIQAADVEIDGYKPGAVRIFYWRWDFLWPVLVLLATLTVFYILSWRRAVINLYTGDRDTSPALGDRILENVRTHGPDPRYRRSWLTSFSAHIIVIVILPLILQMFGCVEPYRVPKGSGNPVVALVKMVKPKKEKKKKYILRPDSAIYFHIPDLNESQIMQQVDQMTQLTYKADPNARPGKMGRGGGTQGGWPEGMENGKIRFIRLQYKGSGWDDGMDDITRADINFLMEFKRLTGFKVADKGESHPIRLLKKYDKGFAPPFVYMTGNGGMDVSGGEIEILREYLLGGGMLFADCGGAGWDRSFRSFAQALFPSEPLRIIADDDPLFQMPYTFPNGAPPLWHHGGTRALGIKVKGRWVLFYHPGDINDAWKSGHSGMDPELARGAFQMGVNIVYYSFTEYLEATKKYRK